jgi:hypothetical protein
VLTTKQRDEAAIRKGLLWFRDMSEVDAVTGCWLWRLTVDSSGYPKIYGRNAHRVVYAIVHGSVGSGLQVDHLCRVKRCVNPDHLEAVTPRENTLRSANTAANNARKTHCKRGHPLDAADVYLMKGKGRTCNACRRLLRSGTHG